MAWGIYRGEEEDDLFHEAGERRWKSRYGDRISGLVNALREACILRKIIDGQPVNYLSCLRDERDDI